MDGVHLISWDLIAPFHSPRAAVYWQKDLYRPDNISKRHFSDGEIDDNQKQSTYNCYAIMFAVLERAACYKWQFRRVLKLLLIHYNRVQYFDYYFLVNVARDNTPSVTFYA